MACFLFLLNLRLVFVGLAVIKDLSSCLNGLFVCLI